MVVRVAAMTGIFQLRHPRSPAALKAQICFASPANLKKLGTKEKLLRNKAVALPRLIHKRGLTVPSTVEPVNYRLMHKNDRYRRNFVGDLTSMVNGI